MNRKNCKPKWKKGKFAISFWYLNEVDGIILENELGIYKGGCLYHLVQLNFRYTIASFKTQTEAKRAGEKIWGNNDRWLRIFNDSICARRKRQAILDQIKSGEEPK